MSDSMTEMYTSLSTYSPDIKYLPTTAMLSSRPPFLIFLANASHSERSVGRAGRPSTSHRVSPRPSFSKLSGMS